MQPLRVALSVLLLVVIAHHASAIQPAGMSPPSRSGPGPGDLIERGGIVDMVEPAQGAIVIDGTIYTVPSGSVRVHQLATVHPGVWQDLRPGTLIRFTSVTDRSTRRIELRDIWITELPARKTRR